MAHSTINRLREQIREQQQKTDNLTKALEYKHNALLLCEAELKQEVDRAENAEMRIIELEALDKIYTDNIHAMGKTLETLRHEETVSGDNIHALHEEISRLKREITKPTKTYTRNYDKEGLLRDLASKIVTVCNIDDTLKNRTHRDRTAFVRTIEAIAHQLLIELSYTPVYDEETDGLPF